MNQRARKQILELAQQRQSFDLIQRLAMTLNHCKGCGPGGSVYEAEMALHDAALDYAKLYPRRK